MEDLAQQYSFASVAPDAKYTPNESSIVEALAKYLQVDSSSGAQSAGDKSQQTDKSFPNIIIGSGMGGGMLARQLSNEGQRFMLLEKGVVPFKTHCLNTSRMHFDRRSQDGPGRDNEVVFDKVRKPYEVAEADKKDFGGGAYFALGGRSLFWSLEAPEIGQSTLKSNFPASVVDELNDSVTTTEVVGQDVGDEGGGETYTETTHVDGWYTKALRVLTNSPPGNPVYPYGQISTETQTTIKTALTKFKDAVKSYSTDDPKVVLNGAEFATGENMYYFPQSAYSTVDWLLDRIFRKSDAEKILLGVEVTKFTLDKDGKTVVSLDLTDNTGKTKSISTKDANVILCTGTIDSAAIALRSGKEGAANYRFKDDHPLVGKGLTDHEIWMAKYWKEISDSETDEQPMELSCHIKVLNHPAFLTICTHAEKFHGHGFAVGDGTTPKELVNVLNIMIEFEAVLNEDGTVMLDDHNIPHLNIKRKRLDTSTAFTDELKKIVNAIRTAFRFPGTDDPVLAKWGAVAHEVGTMRMERPDGKGGVLKGVVDGNLKVDGVGNLFVCDLSVFPVAAMENPARTLTALAMRLGGYLGGMAGDGGKDDGGSGDGSGSGSGNSSGSGGGSGSGNGSGNGSGSGGGIGGGSGGSFEYCTCKNGGPVPYVCPLEVCKYGSW